MHERISNPLPAGKQGGERHPDELSSDPRGESGPTIYLKDLPWTDLRTIQGHLTEEERRAVNRLPAGLTIAGTLVTYALYREDPDFFASRAFWLFDRGVL